MPTPTTRVRAGIGGVILGALLAGLATPAWAEAPNDAFQASVATSPVEVSGHSPSATFVQIPTETSSPLGYARTTVQAVNDSDAGATSLELVGAFTGTVSSSVDLSAEFSRIDSASVFFDSGADDALRVIVRGASHGSDRLAVVTSTSDTAFTDTAVTPLPESAAVDLPTLRLLAPAGSGLIAVHENPDGQYIAQRLTYAFEVNTARPAVTLPFTGSPKLFSDSASGDFFAAGVGEIVTTSLYSPDTATTIPLPGFGQVTSITAADGRALVADDAGHVAVVNTQNGAVVSNFTLPEQPSSLAANASLDEVLAASADGATVWRYATDGTPRSTIDLGGIHVQPGSLRSATTYNITHTLTASAGAASYRYTMNYSALTAIHYTGDLRADERGSGVDLSFSAKGSSSGGDEASYDWEYSLDGGANWVERTRPWGEAGPDAGTTATPLPELPAALDGVAPYLRQDVSGDGVIAPFNMSSTWYGVALPEGGYDALWRVRVTNGTGSVVSSPQRVTVGSGAVDTAARFTQHPASTTVRLGQESRFTVGIAGDPEPTVRWQIARGSGDWEDLTATGTTLRYTTQPGDDGARVRAIAENGGDLAASQPARLTVLSAAAPEIGAAPAGSTVVSGATMNWQLNTYSHEWARDAFGDTVRVAPGQGFDFASGAGWVNPRSGEAQIVWSGTAIYRPYGGMNGLNLTFANPYLAIGSDGRGTLTADVFWNNGGGMGGSGGVGDSGGFSRVVIATYADASARVSDGTLSVSGTPEWDHRPYVAPGLEDAHEYASSFPASFLDYLDRGLRPWFLATGSRNSDKPGIALAGSAAVTELAARTDGRAISPTDPLGDGAQHFAFSLPRITAQPQSVTALPGDSAMLRASAVGTPDPSVVWQKRVDGAWIDIPGAGSPTLQLTDLVAGTFTVRAQFTNRMGSVATQSATVTVTDREEPENPGTPPGDVPPAPAADGDDLPEASRGNLTFTQNGGRVMVSGLEAGAWVATTVYSEPVSLGWARADGGGNISVALPDTLAAGTHRLAVQDRDGTLLGWGEVTVPAAPEPEADASTDGDVAAGGSANGDSDAGSAGASGPGAEAASDSSAQAVTGAELARTGAPSTPLWIGAAALLVVLGAGAAMAARRRGRITPRMRTRASR